MEELLKKEEGLTAWRCKLNRILGRIASLLQGSKGKSVLTNVDGVISWEPVEEKSEVEESTTNTDSLRVEGILSTSSLIVADAASFDCGVSIRGAISGRSLSLSDQLVLKGNGRTETLYVTEKGLTLGPIAVGDRRAELPSTIVLGGNAIIGATSSKVSIYGKACPLKLDTEKGMAEFPYGLRTEKIYFSEVEMDAKSYPGRSATAVRLERPVKVFGNDFDGSVDITGQIKDCTGIMLSKNSKLVFMHGIGQLKAGWFECVGDVLTWNGRLKPKSFNVDTEHYAEWYRFGETMENGDVMSLDFNAGREIYSKASSENGRPLGVVTTDYALCIGMQDSKSYPVCCKGRVKAKVEGKVKIGDVLKVGTTNGVLRTMNSKDKAYEGWALALESSNIERIKLIKVHIL